ncbi:MAG: PqqD family protein [Proteobacteria bacterium]|nr:PqqD family protein [Pseudomonadota bacterium]MBU1585268.1 PqqD family protein [Pseudomonadota bacterium]MBU2455516.1 PqqD family protein [Pseudomonadota bacterium]MBU2626988.1 PqqD family protein [Pseudomonadota bacterium]
MRPDTIYTPSQKIICRDIMGTMVIVPIESGIADFNDVMFSFNETGTIAWKCIEQNKTVKQICSAIALEYESDMDQIEKGVKELIDELLEKGIIVEWKS